MKFSFGIGVYYINGSILQKRNNIFKYKIVYYNIGGDKVKEANFVQKEVMFDVYCDWCEEEVQIIIVTENVTLEDFYEECPYCSNMIQARCVY